MIDKDEKRLALDSDALPRVPGAFLINPRYKRGDNSLSIFNLEFWIYNSL